MKFLLPIFVGVVSMIVGCGDGASEEPETTDPTAPPATVPGAPAGPITGAPATTGAPPSSPSPAGTPAPPAVTTPAGTTATGAFAGAPAYVATLGASTIDTSGKGNGHLSFNAQGNPAGHACLSCHDGAGKGGAPAFLFAGSLYADKAATKPAVRAEVRMVGADGKGLSTYTDTNGNFFFRASAGSTTIPAIAGVRNATMTTSMVNKINDGNCNSCHGAALPLTIP
jgi:hypothetical protein